MQDTRYSGLGANNDVQCEIGEAHGVMECWSDDDCNDLRFWIDDF